METEEFWRKIREEKALSPALRAELVRVYGERGRKAIDALDKGRVMKFRDFIVVRGSSGDYVVEEEFCTCQDYLYRGGCCWHILAVRLATLCDTFLTVDEWYQEKWKGKG
ncbi:MAG: SWIM zinc finger family protein [Methanolinea sp.]|nr:SWIM zinc finger family protein [Methanolinea sp.]